MDVFISSSADCQLDSEFAFSLKKKKKTLAEGSCRLRYAAFIASTSCIYPPPLIQTSMQRSSRGHVSNLRANSEAASLFQKHGNLPHMVACATEEKVPSMSVTLSDCQNTPASGCDSKYSVLYNLNHYSIKLMMTSQADIKSVFLTYLQGYVHVICLQIKSRILEGCKAWFRTGFMMLLSITYWRKEQKFN